MGSIPIVASTSLTRCHAWSGVLFVVVREFSDLHVPRRHAAEHNLAEPRCADTERVGPSSAKEIVGSFSGPSNGQCGSVRPTRAPADGRIGSSRRGMRCFGHRLGGTSAGLQDGVCRRRETDERPVDGERVGRGDAVAVRDVDADRS